MTEEIKPELRKCSRCHSSCTLEHYEKNRQDEWFKLCNNCRGKNKRYYENNTETILDNKKEYGKQYAKDYRVKNKDKIEAYNKEYSARKQAEWMIKDWKVYKPSEEEAKQLEIIKAKRKEEFLIWARKFKLEEAAKSTK